MAHLAGRSQAGSNCFVHLVLSGAVGNSPGQVLDCERAQNEAAKQLKSKGRSPNTAEKPSYRVPGPLPLFLEGPLPTEDTVYELQPIAVVAAGSE